MTLTLLLRLTTRCSGCGAPCPYTSKHSTNEVSTYIKDVINGLTKFVDEGFDESVVLCPVNLRDEYLHDLVKVLKEVSNSVKVFIPLSEVKSLSKYLASMLNELVIVVGNISTELPTQLRTLITNGIENISLYTVLSHSSSLELLKWVISVAKRFGVRVRVGEAPYIGNHIDVHQRLVRYCLGIGLPFGNLYGYRAATTFINDYPVTVLFKDPSECRCVYINPEGKLCRCPLSNECLDLRNARRDIILNVLNKPCKLAKPLPYPSIRIDVKLPNGITIPSEILQLLELIDHTRSLRKACSVLGVSVSTCIEKLRRVERELGSRLVEGYRGGSKHGYTVLTSLGREVLEVYRDVRGAIVDSLISKNIVNFSID